MTMKKFLAPNLLLFLLLSLFWMTGIDTVIKQEDSDQANIQKYLDVQRRILDNHVENIEVEQLFKDSIRGFVANLSDSTLELSGTPLDTTFVDVSIGNIRESVLAFERAYRFLRSRSPEENLDERTEDAVAYMFANLDPHSIYITAEDNQDIQEEFAGKFQGIGVQFEIANDTITVVSALVGGPSEKLGIQSGDRIVAIDGEAAIGFSNQDVITRLRGPKGSTVTVIVVRPYSSERLEFDIVRDDIPLYTVDTNYMLDATTGYIKISRFAATTHQEFMKAVAELRAQGMDRLVLDLRNNPGGYMEQAVKISNEFFPREKTIVSQKGRKTRFNAEYRSYSRGSLQNTPLIMMVNEGSASASEIVSGAVQDHDRGLVVGRRTFGKGLVQQQYELSDGSAMRVTIARYFTPSGRLIQKPYKNGKEEYAYEVLKREDNALTDAMKFIENVPDSLRFETDAGRPVYAGGGILPDHIIEEDTTRSYVFGFMRRKRIASDFVRQVLDSRGGEFRDKWEANYDAFRDQFAWSEDDQSAVKQLMMDKLMLFSDTVKTAHYSTTFDTLYINPKQFDKELWVVNSYLKSEMAHQIWGSKKMWPIFNDAFDATLKRAMELWGEVQALSDLASARPKENGNG